MDACASYDLDQRTEQIGAHEAVRSPEIIETSPENTNGAAVRSGVVLIGDLGGSRGGGEHVRAWWCTVRTLVASTFIVVDRNDCYGARWSSSVPAELRAWMWASKSCASRRESWSEHVHGYEESNGHGEVVKYLGAHRSRALGGEDHRLMVRVRF